MGKLEKKKKKKHSDRGRILKSIRRRKKERDRLKRKVEISELNEDE